MTAIVRDTRASKDPEANATLVRLLVEERVTLPELAYSARMLRRDQELGKAIRFDHPLAFFDFARWIFPLRELRARLESSDFTAYELNRLIADFPGLVSRRNFGVIRHTSAGDPVYKFFRSDEAELRAAMIEDRLKPIGEPSPPTPDEDRATSSLDLKALLEPTLRKAAEVAAKRAHETAEKRSERRRALSAREYARENGFEEIQPGERFFDENGLEIFDLTNATPYPVGEGGQGSDR